MSAPCAIWAARTYDSTRSVDKFQYHSPRAYGNYEISGTAKKLVENLKDHQKAYLTSWLVDQHWAGNPLPLITSYDVERARTAVPKSIKERRDRLMRSILNHTPVLGQILAYREVAMVRVTDDAYEDRFWSVKDALMAATESTKWDEVQKLIAFAVGQDMISDQGGLSLTLAGHNYLDEIQASASANSIQAFVAMWFSDEMTSAYDQGIVPAIQAAGYKPMRIDRKEHNNKIDDEIIAEIRRSRFVVADFTCGMMRNNGGMTAVPRGGVYYEAGFAQGLGIPVIWMCSEDHIDHVHFDTRQFNHITWKTPDELREKLRNRIGAVLGDGPLVSDT